VEQLAKARGVSASSIYKAEQTPKVLWKTVENAYGGLFPNPQEHLETLVLWALEQTQRKVDFPVALRTATLILSEEQSIIKGDALALETLISQLTPVDSECLLRFARLFRSSEPARMMVRAWLAAVDEKN